MGFGSSDFISFLPPPGSAIADYDRNVLPQNQPSSIPRLFLDAMSVRESVFVEEQHVPLERELDADDPAAYHWIAYASVSRRRSSGAQHGQRSSSDGAGQGARIDESSGHRESKSSTAIRVPAGTIRLLAPHEEGKATAQIAPHPVQCPNEPYVLLGRLAIVQAYRKLGMGRLLVNAALDWARTNGSGTFTKTLTPAEVEARKLEGTPADDPLWKGLVVVHSQKGEAEEFWRRVGFVRDEGMGEWDEEGIMHVGMWRRMEGPGVVGRSASR